jgi:hypothetical protein
MEGKIEHPVVVTKEKENPAFPDKVKFFDQGVDKTEQAHKFLDQNERQVLISQENSPSPQKRIKISLENSPFLPNFQQELRKTSLRSIQDHSAIRPFFSEQIPTVEQHNFEEAEEEKQSPLIPQNSHNENEKFQEDILLFQQKFFGKCE